MPGGPVWPAAFGVGAPTGRPTVSVAAARHHDVCRLRHRPSSGGSGALQSSSRCVAGADLRRPLSVTTSILLRGSHGCIDLPRQFSTASHLTRDAPSPRDGPRIPGRASARLNEHGHNYTQVGGPIDPSVCSLSESDIHSRLRERTDCQRAREFERANAIEAELKRAGINLDNKEKFWRADGRLYWYQLAQKRKDLGIDIPRVKDCKSLGEAVDTTYEHLDLLTHRQTASFWAAAPVLLEKGGGNSAGGASRFKEKVEAILTRTLEDARTYSPQDLSWTAVFLARLVKLVRGPKDEFPKGGPHQSLRELLVGNDAEREKVLFDVISEAVPTLRDFNPKDLSNLLYAYALVGHVPQSKDGRTLFDRLAGRVMTALDNGEAFAPEELTSILWSFAAIGVSHPELFERVGDHIASSFDNMGAFKALGLSNIARSYSIAKVSHPVLFERIAGCIVALDNLDSYNSQNLSGLIAAYENDAELYPLLFEKIANHVIARGDAKSLDRLALGRLSNALYKSHPELSTKLVETCPSLSLVAIAERIVRPPSGFGKPIFSQRHSLGKSVDAAFEHLDKLKPGDLAAFWNVVARLLLLEEGRAQPVDGNPQAADQLGIILERTLKDMATFTPRDLGSTTVALAKISKSVRQSSQELPDDDYRSILHNLIADSKCFMSIAEATLPVLHVLGPGTLSKIIRAFAIVQYEPIFDDGSTFFGEAAAEVVNLLETAPESFEPQHLASIARAYGTADEHHPEIFEMVANHIVNLDSLDSWDPPAVSHIAKEYARLGISAPNLFERLAEYIFSLDSLEGISARDLSSTVWAFAKVKESHPTLSTFRLFKKVSDHIVSLENL